MSKNWYPIIDYEKCTSCLSCISFCHHGVFVEREGRPVVVSPEKCIEFCRGCQRGACDSGAISYFGDKIITIQFS